MPSGLPGEGVALRAVELVAPAVPLAHEPFLERGALDTAERDDFGRRRPGNAEEAGILCGQSWRHGQQRSGERTQHQGSSWFFHVVFSFMVVVCCSDSANRLVGMPPPK